MAALIYGLCAVTSALCAWLLSQAHRRVRNRLLFWTGLFFVILTGNNVLLIVDKVFTPPEVDLTIYRYMGTLIAQGVLLWGLILDVE